MKLIKGAICGKQLSVNDVGKFVRCLACRRKAVDVKKKSVRNIAEGHRKRNRYARRQRSQRSKVRIYNYTSQYYYSRITCRINEPIVIIALTILILITPIRMMIQSTLTSSIIPSLLSKSPSPTSPITISSRQTLSNQPTLNPTPQTLSNLPPLTLTPRT